MLRNLIIISSSGIVLFSKEFIRAVAKPRMIGGLITAMLDFSEQRTGLPVSFIDLSTVGVAVCSNPACKVICALFYDIEDGHEFGKLIASEILHSFVSTYANDGKIDPNEQDEFAAFNYKISETIRNAVKPVLDNLHQQRGITLALLTSGDAITHSTLDVDKIGVLANIQALLNVSGEIMNAKNDSLSRIVLKGDRTSVMLIRIERTSLVVVCKNSVKQEIIDTEINKAVSLLHKVIVVASNLQDVWHMNSIR